MITTMKQSIRNPFSIGYLNPGTLELLQDRVNHEAVILNIRLIAASRYHDSGGRILDGREWSDMPPEVPARTA